MTSRAAEARLYGILDSGYAAEEDFPRLAAALLEGGVGILQIRAKTWSADQIVRSARAVAPLCQKAGIPLILNDYPELVEEASADGVHIGQDDMPVEQARRLMPPGKLLGLSTHSLEQAKAAIACRPDYTGFGPLFATRTKPDYRPIGVTEIQLAVRESPHPVFCIGGIHRDNLPAVMAAGARRVVIVSAILQSPDPAAYCRDCVSLLQSAASKSLL